MESNILRAFSLIDGQCKISILNMRSGPEWHYLRWTSYEEFMNERNGSGPVMSDYNLVYTEDAEVLFPEWTSEQIEADVFRFLEHVYCTFQDGRVESYKGHSLSMSDVIGLSNGCGKVHWFYVDTYGFKMLEGFIKP